MNDGLTYVISEATVHWCVTISSRDALSQSRVPTVSGRRKNGRTVTGCMDLFDTRHGARLRQGVNNVSSRLVYAEVLAALLFVLASLIPLGRPNTASGSYVHLLSSSTCGGEITWQAAVSHYPLLARLPDGGTVIYQHNHCHWEVSFTSRPPHHILATLLDLHVPTAWGTAQPSPPRPTPEQTQPQTPGPDFAVRATNP
jgi:hypothetical protein